MGIHVAEDLASSRMYHFTDPDAFLHCDNPHCDVPWVTHAGLVCWPLDHRVPNGSRFTDRLLVACSADCLHAATRARGKGTHYWSESMPVGEWLDALRDSLDRDPATIPIGEFAVVR